MALQKSCYELMISVAVRPRVRAISVRCLHILHGVYHKDSALSTVPRA
jgi:hypothetical protein